MMPEYTGHPEHVKHNAVAKLRFVPIEQVECNQYNPNSVATNEMRLLYLSIKSDTYTQPVVTIWDDEKQKYVIVDGFHRYTTMKMNKDIYDMNKGLLPIVVIEKDINDRMASTVRHNRARGKHSVTGMSSMVFSMLQNGMSDADVCNELGMEPDELVRLKHITGFSKLFKDAQYSRAWETENQIKLKKEYANESRKS
jgi:ParB-like chromosome segregation protein Spo0J